MIKHECGGAFGQALAAETLTKTGDIFYVSKDNRRPKAVKVSKENLLVVKGKKGEVKLFHPEKILTDVQLSSEACDRWRATPDASFRLQKGIHLLPVYFEVICNPCLFPQP
ncbi:hypothetical protein [Thermaurantimonas sp.]|uniref:hypothetical protein n=1 Tax=Thermaurantimonas sp. TaxID=2681568 RepID=UPI00391C0C03